MHADFKLYISFVNIIILQDNTKPIYIYAKPQNSNSLIMIMKILIENIYYLHILISQYI